MLGQTIDNIVYLRLVLGSYKLVENQYRTKSYWLE